MVQHRPLPSAFSPRIIRTAVLAFFWSAGFCLGIYIASQTNKFVSSMMRAAPFSSVSIVGLFVVSLLPLIVSAFAVYGSAPLAILPVAFLKAFGFAFCSEIILSAYGSAGWLVRFLLLFSDSCVCVILLWFWFRNINGATYSTKKELAVCTGMTLLLGSIDYFFICPFLLKLFQ